MNWLSLKLLNMLVALLSNFKGNHDTERDILVQTHQGLIRGTTLTSQRSNRSFFAFMGIPYAKPPVGNLRFKAPQPPEKWSGIKNTTIEGSVCPQVNKFTDTFEGQVRDTFEGQEDCLFLNVYTEKLPTNQKESLRPVMFSIHGGALVYGSGNRDTQGPDFLVDHGVVVVTFNYRLGVLGFLSLQNAEVPGNNGLKDQVMALRWVQQNIAQFGGDPNNVTIFGVSTGGASVSLLMLSPMSQGLFHRAISQSGPILNSWKISTSEECIRHAMDAAKDMGITATDTKVLWKALVNASFHDLIPIIRKKTVFIPTVDAMAPEGEVFLPDTPRNMLNAGEFRNVPFLAGLTSNEGIVLLKALEMGPIVLQYILPVLLSQSLDMKMDETSEREAMAKISNFYYGNSDFTNTTVQQSIRMLTDIMIHNGVYCMVKKHAELSTSPIYMYQFSFSGNLNVFKMLHGGLHLPGASHSDDLTYIYQTTFHNKSFVPNSAEYITSERMVTMWTNFAKYGNPTPKAHNLLQNVTWTPVTATNFGFLNIGQDLIVGREIRRDVLNFWEDIYRKYTSHSMCD